MFYNTGTIIGFASVIIIVFLTTYFFDSDNLEYTPVEFGVILNDSNYYSSSDITEWQRINIGAFEIQTPKEFKLFRLRGYDSYVGGLTNQKDTFYFDYGMYPNPLIGFSPPEFKIITELIDNKKFRIVIGQDKIRYIAAFTEDLNDEKRFMIECPNCNNPEEKLKIIQTIKFKRK